MLARSSEARERRRFLKCVLFAFFVSGPGAPPLLIAAFLCPHLHALFFKSRRLCFRPENIRISAFGNCQYPAFCIEAQRGRAAAEKRKMAVNQRALALARFQPIHGFKISREPSEAGRG